MIPLLPDFSFAIAPQAMPQPGAMPVSGAASGLDFAGLLGAALPSTPAGLPDPAAQSVPARPLQTAPVSVVPAPSVPPAFLPELQPLLQTQPQASTLPDPAAITVPLPPPTGTPLPSSGAIVPDAVLAPPAEPDFSQRALAPLQTLPEKPVSHGWQPADNEDEPTATASTAAHPEDLGPEGPEQAAVRDASALAVPAALPTPPSLLPERALMPPATSLAAEAEAPAPDAVLPEPSISPPSPSTAPARPIAALPEAQVQAAAVRAPLALAAKPDPLQPPAAGAVRRGVAGVEPFAAGIAPLPLALPRAETSEPGPVPSFTTEPPATAPSASLRVPSTSSAPSTPLVVASPRPVDDAMVGAAPIPSPVAPLAVAHTPIASPPPEALAQRPEMQAKDVRKVVTTSLAGVAEPAHTPLAPAPAAPANDAAPQPSSLAPSPVQAPASPSPSAMPVTPVIVIAPEPSAAPEPARAAPAPQLEQTITAVGDLREALRAARPEMTLRHAEFGAVSMRLEAAGAQDWRVVLASRDPGFVPAIQAALAERVVAAAAETSLAGHGGQNGSGEPRYGSSLGSGQGGSQPYSGQHTSRDEGGLAHHQQQRQQRGSGTSAAADAGPQPGDGSPRERGLFA